MNDVIYSLLNSLLPDKVFLQGTLTGAFPDEFVTFWNNSSEDGSNFDNETMTVNYRYQVNVYGQTPSRIASLAAAIRRTLKNAGFIPDGVGYDLPTDRPPYIAKTMTFDVIQVFSETPNAES